MSFVSNSSRWEKLGLVFQPDLTRWWMKSHAALPTPVRLKNGLVRVFFASRTEQQRSHVGWFDIDLEDPCKVLSSSDEPVLLPGSPGCFDGDGIYPASIVSTGGLGLRLYTIGWNAGDPAPMFYAAVGAAESTDDGLTFNKMGKAPLMARSEHDPCMVTSPFVLRDEGVWRMWYVSGKSWSKTERGLRSHYDVKYAHSDDGINWTRNGHTCLSAREPQESNISRFWVVKAANVYHAFFGYHRGEGYRIGYARSTEGINWDRQDDLSGIGCSDSGWDCDSISYPAVIPHGKRWYMFYNGNGFGRDGIGLAVCDPFR